MSQKKCQDELYQIKQLFINNKEVGKHKPDLNKFGLTNKSVGRCQIGERNFKSNMHPRKRIQD